MNQKQKIFNLLAKTGKTQMSKSRKVNFAIADDLDAALEEAMDSVRMTSIQIEAAYEMVAELIGQIPAPDTFYQDIEGPQTRLQMVIGRARAAAEELGIDPRDSISGFVEAEDIIQSFKEVEEAIGRYEDDMTAILAAGGLR